jgi:hypothetical protein
MDIPFISHLEKWRYLKQSYFLFSNEIFSQIRADKNYESTEKKCESETNLFWLKMHKTVT